jgi:hypothetical protein
VLSEETQSLYLQAREMGMTLEAEMYHDWYLLNLIEEPRLVEALRKLIALANEVTESATPIATPNPPE